MNRSILITAFAFISFNAFAYDFKVDGIYYNVTSADNKTVEVTYEKNWSGYGYGYPYRCTYTGNIIIPETVSYNGTKYTVTRIGDYAFGTSNSSSLEEYCHNLKSITIPSSITTIGDMAFWGCEDVVEIIFPETIISFYKGCFANCNSLSKLIFLSATPPEVITSGLGNYNYIYCGNSTRIYVPDKNKYLSESIWESSESKMVEMVSPESKEFTYNGKNQKVIWNNNLNEYDCEISEGASFKTSGEYTDVISVTYKKNGVKLFSFELPYSVVVKKAVLTVNIKNASREYGENNPTFTYTSITGYVNNENSSVIKKAPTLVCDATKTSNVGDYSITINGGEAQNYDFVCVPGVLTVKKAKLQASVNSITKTYGSNLYISSYYSPFSISYIGLKNGETEPEWITSPSFQTSVDQFTEVGQYEIQAINAVPLNYTLDGITPGAYSVTPAPLIIYPYDAYREYYTNNPVFSYDCEGIMYWDNENVLTTKPVLTTTATISSSVGNYDIVATGGSCNKNYSIEYKKGTLHVRPKALTASVANYERSYNEDNPTFIISYYGFVGGDNEEVLTSKCWAYTDADKTSDVGEYTIYVTGGSAQNYTFKYSNGLMVINKADQTITWDQDLNNLKVGDQVVLTAVASSGLPVTYKINETDIAEVYTAGNSNETYLDCIKMGEVTIRAYQDGNKNYYSTTRLSKTAIIGDGNSVVSISNSLITIQNTTSGVKLTGLKVGDKIGVYSINGALVETFEARSQSIEIPLVSSGVYVVIINDIIFKISY